MTALNHPQKANQRKLETTFLKQYRPSDFLIPKVNLQIILDLHQTQVTATLFVQRDLTQKGSADLVLTGEQINLKSIAINGVLLAPSSYLCEPEKDNLTIKSVPDQFELMIVNTVDPLANTALSGLYYTNGIFCTQCEAEGFRRITYFLDRPDVMAIYTTTIMADKKRCPVLLSNGNPIEKGESLDNPNQHWITWHDPFPKPSYLFALVAGPLVALEDHFLTQSGRLVTLKIFVEPDNQDSCAHAMNALKRAMHWDEMRYGREYDLDIYMIVAVNDFNMGAMENKGLNVFNAKYILARPEFATDRDFSLIDAVVGHEYFHNWSGNRVTCRDWFQLCLKEGLTVFREQHFSEDAFESPTHRIENIEFLRSKQFVEDAGPTAHSVRPDAYLEINNFYTSTVYEKGAEVIRMLKVWLGAEVFRKGMDRYFADNDGRAATVEDFLAAMSAVSGKDLTQFFLWYTQAGTPVLRLESEYDSQKGEYQLRCEQYCPSTPGQLEKQPMVIPLSLGLLDTKGKDMPGLSVEVLENPEATQKAGLVEHRDQGYLLILTKEKQVFRFQGVRERPVLSPLRGFSAPVTLQMEQSNEDWRFILKHDSDPINRWDASQRLSRAVLLDWIADPLEIATKPNPLTSVYQDILVDSEISQDLKVTLLSPPSVQELRLHLPVISIEAIEVAYRHWILTLGLGLADSGFELYRQLQTQSQGQYRYEPKAIAVRGLKNILLFYLVQTGASQAVMLAEQQYRQAQHMTDRLGAMRALNHLNTPVREMLLTQYEQQWQHHPLAMNKWFALQAQSWLPSTLAKVQALTKHAQFSWHNPNNVYNLVNGFASLNPFRFHQADGEAYEWLKDGILKLDPANPQVAARLMSNFSDWRKFSTLQQTEMKNQITAILGQPKLSKDVLELAEKFLGEAL